jgi:hypothetical protein
MRSQYWEERVRLVAQTVPVTLQSLHMLIICGGVIGDVYAAWL